MIIVCNPIAIWDFTPRRRAQYNEIVENSRQLRPTQIYLAKAAVSDLLFPVASPPPLMRASVDQPVNGQQTSG